MTKCDEADGRPAVAFAYWYYSGPRGGGVLALCQVCLDRYAADDGFYYVRFEPLSGEGS